VYGVSRARPFEATESSPFSEWRVIRPGHWERAQISEMGIIGS
jgi:hypothetical protein